MRADIYLTEKGFFTTRTKAKQAIDRNEVLVNGLRLQKSSADIKEDDEIEIISDAFVSVGGYKLEKAVKEFGLDFSDLTLADIGASTGGFTDCALKYGAKTVYAVDLNDGLLSEKLKKDSRVVPIINGFISGR